MSQYNRLGGKILTGPFLGLLAITLLACALLLNRFMNGLGAVTNLSDGYPWGLWIVYDVLIGTALGCGGYAMALVVYVMNRGQYHPLVRPALLTSLFGYTLAGVAIFIDVGRYWQIYNVFLPWHANLNSIMFEVAFCIGTYIFILWLEFSPVFFKQWKWTKSEKFMNRILFVLIALGVLLPTMHQSSLGTLMVIAGEKLSPIWQSNWLPVTFLITAILMGYGMVIFESLWASISLKRPLETDMLGKLSKLIPWVTGLYLIIRFGDLMARGELITAVSGGFLSSMFIIETVLFLIPAVLIPKMTTYNKNRVLFYSSLSLVLGGALLRFNTFLIGFNPGEGWHYFPAASEIIITLGIITGELMLYLIFVKKLPVLPDLKHA